MKIVRTFLINDYEFKSICKWHVLVQHKVENCNKMSFSMIIKIRIL